MISELRKSFRLGADYLKATAYSLIFYAILFSAISWFSQYSKKQIGYLSLLTPEQFDLISKEQAGATMASLTTAFIAVVAVSFIAYIITTYLAYITITKSRFSIKTALKFIPAFLIICLILFIPLVFTAKLLEESAIYIKVIAAALFLILLLAYFHLANTAYYFLASENRLWQSIKKAFTQKLRKFIIPYFFAAIMTGIMTLAGLLINLLPKTVSSVIVIIISAFFINWLRILAAKPLKTRKI